VIGLFFRKFDFVAGMKEAPDDLKFLLEDLESIPWRRRKWERQGTMRMMIERTSNDKWLKFHDEQAKLLSSLQRGPRKSFMGQLSAEKDGHGGGASDLPAKGLVLSFSQTFFLRLMIATSVTFACLNSVVHVRTSLNAFGPPNSCNPFDPKYSPCSCKNVVERCTYRFDDCVSICDAAASTVLWEKLHTHQHPDKFWDNARKESAWADSAGTCKTGAGANLDPKCVAYQYFKTRGDRDWCLHMQQVVNKEDGVDYNTTVIDLRERVTLEKCTKGLDDKSRWAVPEKWDPKVKGAHTSTD
jgi:hypothetical protein